MRHGRLRYPPDEDITSKLNSYGIAVRAGAVTRRSTTRTPSAKRSDFQACRRPSGACGSSSLVIVCRSLSLVLGRLSAAMIPAQQSLTKDSGNLKILDQAPLTPWPGGVIGPDTRRPTDNEPAALGENQM